MPSRREQPLTYLTVAILVKAPDEYLASLLGGKDLPAEVCPRVAVGQVRLDVAVVQLRSEAVVEDDQLVLKGASPGRCLNCLRGLSLNFLSHIIVNIKIYQHCLNSWHLRCPDCR